jgi:hypothetical protein
VRQIMTALELFFNDNNRYPTATSGAPTEGDGDPAFSTVMAKYPTYPTPVDNASGSSACDDNTAYTYTQVSNTTYTITFCLGGVTGGLAAGDHTASQAGIQ